METPSSKRTARRWGVAGLAAGLVLGASGGILAYREFFDSPDVCRSPAAESLVYTGDGEMTGSRNWRLGVIATTNNLLPDATMVVGFRNVQSSLPRGESSPPLAPQGVWRDSDPLSAEESSSVLVYIGEGDVQFRTQYEAPVGSAACNITPSTSYRGPIPLEQLPEGTEPQWRK